MSKFYCPYCDHKSFRNESGLQWHLEHVHSDEVSKTKRKPGPISGENVTLNNQHDTSRELKEFEQSIIEKVNSRLDVFTKRDSWLSDRISVLEEGGKCRIPLKAKCTLQKSSCVYHPKLNFESNRS